LEELKYGIANLASLCAEMGRDAMDPNTFMDVTVASSDR
jgi:hypothetical protein